jgi:hypothetical protein
VSERESVEPELSEAELDELALATQEPYDEALTETEHAAMLRRARQKGGVGGAMMVGAMMALQGIIEGPRKDPIAVVVAAPTEPINPDAEGISLQLSDRTLFAPPLAPMRAPKAKGRKWGTSGRRGHR